MIDVIENHDNFEPEYPSYVLEDPKYVLEVLKEYHEQTVEDCRIIGNQKYTVLISLSIALGSFIYALTPFCALIGANDNYTLEGTLNTLYHNTPSILSFSANTSSILSGSIDIASITFPQKIIIAMMLTSLILFICLVIMGVSSFVFLTMHLPVMDAFSIKIEELQRDILFKKMGSIDLFSWDEIKTNKSNTFKDYIKQKYISKNIASVSTNSFNDQQIQINVEYKRKIDITKKGFLIKNKNTGTLDLDKKKKIAILTIDGIVLDQFNLKDKNSDFILYESEMKYRFRDLMPHSNALKQSINVLHVSLTLSIIALVVIWFLTYRYYHTFLFWL